MAFLEGVVTVILSARILFGNSEKKKGSPPFENCDKFLFFYCDIKCQDHFSHISNTHLNVFHQNIPSFTETFNSGPD